ncbi:MAG: HAMP domain-containing sensor histidine kinase [Bacteroidota bacterium]
MKLVYKNIIINAVVSVLILFIGEFSLYVFLKNNIEKEAVEHLYLERYFMTKQLEHGVDIEYFKHNIGDELEVDAIEALKYTVPVLEDVEMEEPGEEEHFTSKKIVFDVMQKGKAYRVSILKTIDEDEGLAGSLAALIFISAILMATILVIINVFVYYRLFSPLYQLIRDIKRFSVHALQKITPPKTSTKEFMILSDEISKMSAQIISDYTSMKEFTENMTHEMQTPLAVISTKIERCIQDKNLTNEQAILLTDAAKAVNKLFNISKGLTLLCKLDNKQYTALTGIGITELVKQRINYFLDFIDNKQLTLTENYKEEVFISMDVSLSEIMIDNLLKNAVQHNIQNGKILVTLEKKRLTIANTGNITEALNNRNFDRFYSQSQNTSLGLGLSIVKKIADYYGFKLSYQYENDLHCIVIDFEQ